MKIKNKLKGNFIGAVSFTSSAFIFSLVLVLFPLGHSAEIPTESESIPLSFINFQDNKITFKPTENSLEIFENQMEMAQAGEEPLRILHIGDSHIQADMFTGETRRLFAQWFTDKNLGRGFSFPYQLAGTNNPFDFEVSSTVGWKRERIMDVSSSAKLGIAGIALFSKDSVGKITVNLKKPWSVADGFDLVKVYYDEELSKVEFNSENSGEVISHKDGLWVFQLESADDSFSLEYSQLGNDGQGFRLYGIELLNTHSKMIYHAVGLNGAEVRTYLLSENMEKHLVQINPHVVIISLGTNDAYNSAFNAEKFHQNLVELVCRIRSTNPEIMIILTTPGDHLVLKQNENPSLELIQNEIYRVANEWNCGVWDFYHIMGGAGSIRLWSHHGLCAPDLLHLNRNGYKLQGALLFNALVELSGFDPSSSTFQELASK